MVKRLDLEEKGVEYRRKRSSPVLKGLISKERIEK